MVMARWAEVDYVVHNEMRTGTPPDTLTRYRQPSTRSS